MSSVSARLRRIAERARAGALLGADGVWLADGIELYLKKVRDERRRWSIDDALGISPASTGEPWWIKEDPERGHELLRELWEAFYDHLDLKRAAVEIGRIIDRYRLSRWPIDSGRNVMPPTYAETKNALLFAAFHATGGKVSGNPRNLARILSGENDNEKACRDLAMRVSGRS